MSSAIGALFVRRAFWTHVFPHRAACYFFGVVALHDRILRFMDDADSGIFEDLALAVFEYQFASCAPYERYCRGQNHVPGSVTDWHDIPAVPVEAFKQVDLCCGQPERVFLSTGTTAGKARRSRHLMPDLALYRRSAILGMQSHLFPDVRRMRLASLVPSPSSAPDSSLSQMIDWAFQEFGDSGSEYIVSEGRVDFERLAEVLRDCERRGTPVCLFSTTGTLIRGIDHFQQRGLTFRLPHGSRLMDTGGDKGAPRPMSYKGLLHACWSAFAIPGYFCVNEYGMTELSSQYYDSVIADRVHGRHRPRRKIGPHWLRTLVLDPASLAPVAPGQPGLLCHFDLANAASAMAVLSEDMGACREDGLDLLGRASGAETRGCSLGAAEWHAA